MRWSASSGAHRPPRPSRTTPTCSMTSASAAGSPPRLALRLLVETQVPAEQLARELAAVEGGCLLHVFAGALAFTAGGAEPAALPERVDATLITRGAGALAEGELWQRQLGE